MTPTEPERLNYATAESDEHYKLQPRCGRNCLWCNRSCIVITGNRFWRGAYLDELDELGEALNEVGS